MPLRLLVAFAALLLYASFYPFEFDLTRHFELAWGSSSWGDRLVNVLAYAPLGFLIAVVSPRRPLAAAMLLGFATSLLVEAAQNATRMRNPNLADVASNTAGSLLGALACLPARSRAATRLDRLRLVDLTSPAALLLSLWFAMHSAPFIAVIDVSKMRHSFDARWTWCGVARWCAMWWIFGAAARKALRTRWMLPLIAASFLMRVFFLKQRIGLDEVPGVLFCWMPAGWPLVAVACAAMLLPAGRTPAYLSWMETVYLAAGAGWLAAGRVKKGSP